MGADGGADDTRGRRGGRKAIVPQRDAVVDTTRGEDEPNLMPGNAVGTATPEGIPVCDRSIRKPRKPFPIASAVSPSHTSGVHWESPAPPPPDRIPKGGGGGTRTTASAQPHFFSWGGGGWLIAQIPLPS